MNRIYLIKEILNCYENPAYLEIGYGDGCCFDTIEVQDKTCVDPVSLHNFGKLQGNWKLTTSDDFFEQNTKKYDVIFIDGNHQYEQVTKDFKNSKNFIKENGCIILHDCSPPDVQHTIPGLCGDGGYRMFSEFYQKNTDFIWSTSFEDYGTCVVRSGNRKGIVIEDYDDSYEMFDRYRKEILNLKPISLLTIETKNSIIYNKTLIKNAK